MAMAEWNLNGNSGTNPEQHFLGTTDNQDLVIRTSGQKHIRISANVSEPQYCWVTVNGNVQIDSMISCLKRMHIGGGEELYILNKNGVIVGTEWGGNGNLTVEGNLGVAGNVIVFTPPPPPGEPPRTPGRVGIGTTQPHVSLEVVEESDIGAVRGTSGFRTGVCGITGQKSGEYPGESHVKGVYGLNVNPTSYKAVGVWGEVYGPGVGVYGKCPRREGKAGFFEGNVEVSEHLTLSGHLIKSGGGTLDLDGNLSVNSGRIKSGGGTLYVDGNLNVTGGLTKTSGGFEIDHPLDPENKYLSHSFVESPDMKNIYDGVTTLDERGEAVVELADWFETLNRDFRYQLTAIGGPAPNLHIAEEVAGNRFRIAGGRGGMKVSWTLTGIRQDAWAEENRILVESAKTDRDR